LQFSFDADIFTSVSISQCCGKDKNCWRLISGDRSKLAAQDLASIWRGLFFYPETSKIMSISWWFSMGLTHLAVRGVTLRCFGPSKNKGPLDNRDLKSLRCALNLGGKSGSESKVFR
jgi:hypothetical protein